MIIGEDLDHLALFWALEHKAARHTLNEIATATGIGTTEISERLQDGVVAIASTASIEARRAVILEGITEGLSIKDLARRALAPRAWVARVAAGVFQEAMES